jgi:diamine N-acetyltransferase
MMFIEVLKQDQIEMVESLAREIWTEHYTPIIGREQVDYMIDRFQSRQAISGQMKMGMLYYLIKEDNEIIGYIGAQPKRAELFLSKIYVRSSKRGKGCGRKAIQFIEKVAKGKKLAKVVLTVNKNNVNSIKAYERIGFRIVGSIIQDIGSGFVMDDYKMEKTV